MRGVTGLVAMLGIVLAVAPLTAAQRATAQLVTGVALDATGTVLPNADVVLMTPSDALVLQTTTDTTGNFRFEAVPQGRYELHVAFAGFQPTTAQLTVAGRPPSALRMRLKF